MSTPTISSISPTSGSIEGGKSVTISGTNLSDATSVTIGTNDATNLNVTSSDEITCTTPAGTATGPVDVVVTISSETWTQTSASTSLGWLAIAMSGSGQYQTAVIDSGTYNSSDYGNSWIQSGAPSWHLTSVSITSDNQLQVACCHDYTNVSVIQSSNGGITWSISYAINSGSESVSISSSTGQYQTMVATANSNGQGGIFYSTNTGLSWNTSTASTSIKWTSVSVSSDGTYQTAVSNGGGIWTSNTPTGNYGATWSQVTTDTLGWSSVSISSDGQYQTAVANGGGIWTSNNYGAISSWLQSSASAQAWSSVSVSSDGQYQIACVNVGGVYNSNNYGATWNPNTSLSTTGNWYGVAISSDGTHQSACASLVGTVAGGIWTAAPTSSNSLTYTYTQPIISNICFPAGTPIATDQGNIPIDKINPDIHTIHNRPIVAITKTITQDTHLVCFEKHAFDHFIPNSISVEQN